MLTNYILNQIAYVPIRMYDTTGALVSSAVATTVSIINPGSTTVNTVSGASWTPITTGAFATGGATGLYILGVPASYVQSTQGPYTVAVLSSSPAASGAANFTVRTNSELDIMTLLGALNSAAGTGSFAAILAQMIGKANFNTSDAASTIASVHTKLGTTADTNATSSVFGGLAQAMGKSQFVSAATGHTLATIGGKTTNLPADTSSALTTMDNTLTTLGLKLDKVLGALFYNAVQDQQIWTSGRLTSARIRVFDTQASADAVSAGTGTASIGVGGLTAIYAVTAAYDGSGNLTLFKITG